MTKYQAWKLYGRYVLRRIRKRIRMLLSRMIPGLAGTMYPWSAGKRQRAKRGCHG